MSSLFPAPTPQFEMLHELFSAATRDASVAMGQWTNGQISLTLDEVRSLPLEEVCNEFDFGDEQLTMVILSLQGEVGGEMILCFDDVNGRQLAASLLNREVATSDEWTELEKSALMETGNILGCAYLNALTKLTGDNLIPSPPYFVQDYGASVLQQALLAQAMTSDEALICSTCFKREGQRLQWNVFFIPTLELRNRMEHALLA